MSLQESTSMSKKEEPSLLPTSWDEFVFPDFIGRKDKFQQIMEQAYIDIPEDIKLKSIRQVVGALITKIEDDAIGDYLFDTNLEERSRLLSILKHVTSRDDYNPNYVASRDTEYGVKDTPYVATADELYEMYKQTELLLQWYDDEYGQRGQWIRYAAPCVPIIQSSGTGKTKLLFEFRARCLAENDRKLDVKLISCLPKKHKRASDTSLYDSYLDFAGREKDRTYLSNQLDLIIGTASDSEDMNHIPVVLLFDEAQELSRDHAAHMTDLRKFLRKKRRNRKVVAFIAGTNHSLANCYPTKEQRYSSREGEPVAQYYQSGLELYPPIIELFTMGCFAKKISFPENFSEFDRSIPYGRPLFARLLLGDGMLDSSQKWPAEAKRSMTDDQMAVALSRLLLNRTSPFDQSSASLLPFLSVWSTRVQLGGVSSAVVETLVARGYAHLTGFRSIHLDDDLSSPPRPTATHSNLPDPVIARLAMCVMEKDWSLEGANMSFQGVEKTRWTEKLKAIFSSGLCRPSRGDIGEVVSAAYMLFCADAIRYEQDRTLRTFSVPVDDWVGRLFSPKNASQSSKMERAPTMPLVNFIQFCRNNLRLGLVDICKQAFLEYIYNSCCAIYAHGCAQHIDAYAAIKCCDEQGERLFVPLLISIKTRAGYTNESARKNVDDIVKAMTSCGQKCGLVLAVLLDRDSFGSTREDEVSSMEEDSSRSEKSIQLRSTKKPKTWQQIATESMTQPVTNCCSTIVSRVVSIPDNDPFHLSDVVSGATRAQESCAVFDSHCFAGIVPESDICGARGAKDERFTNRLLVENAETNVQDKLAMLWGRRGKALQSTPTSEEGNGDAVVEMELL